MKRIFVYPHIAISRDNYGNQHSQHHSGLESRDYFAAQALTGLLANTKLTKTANDNFKGDHCNE